ncbi:hypothetical protein [Streptomyces sp. NBC_01235]|uniref:hypothetical protein n=1 Tax=Streptomyces sp. NBC_01235 TaxID=2903788 RepID=UPI002E100BF6|nr:hypothetical protein OG289_04100 [Streptomyces sp. NBC_01235]
MSGVTKDDPKAVIPLSVFAAFQALFAALTAALICGEISDRIKFGARMAFTGVLVTLVYPASGINGTVVGAEIDHGAGFAAVS